MEKLRKENYKKEKDLFKKLALNKKVFLFQNNLITFKKVFLKNLISDLIPSI